MSGTQDQKRVNTHNTVVSVIHAASLITSLCHWLLQCDVMLHFSADCATSLSQSAVFLFLEVCAMSPTALPSLKSMGGCAFHLVCHTW